jgi:hypothetical protein
MAGEHWFNGLIFVAIGLVLVAVACAIWLSLPIAAGVYVLGSAVALASVISTHRSFKSTMHKFIDSALPAYRAGELNALNNDELAELVDMTNMEPRLKERVAEWKNSPKMLRKRDLLACRDYFERTEELRERDAILSRLAATE